MMTTCYCRREDVQKFQDFLLTQVEEYDSQYVWGDATMSASCNVLLVILGLLCVSWYVPCGIG